MDSLPSSDTIESLDQDRIELLQRINGGKGGEGTHLDRLRTQYNELMDRMDVYNASPLVDPLTALPIEIWEDIIAEFFVPYSISRVNRWYINSLLPLTLVSKHWKQNIISTPRFWTRIQIYEIEEDLEAKLATCIHLSSNLPLDIHVGHLSSLSWDVIAPILAPQSPRILSLSFMLDHSPGFEEALPLVKFLKSFGKLPVLENLSILGISRLYPNLDFLLESSTRMRSIKGIHLSPDTLRLHSMQKLRCLEVQQSHDELLPHLQNLQHLREVRFSSSVIEFDDDAMDASNFEPEGEDILKQTQQPREWISLGLSHLPSKSIWSLLNSVSYTLHECIIRIPIDLLPKLITACSNMAQLSLLSLYLLIPRQSKLHPGSISGYSSRIQSLILTIKQSYRYSTGPDQSLGSRDAEIAKNTVETIIMWSPEVKRLILFTDFDSFLFLPYVRNLQHLTSLSTVGFTGFGETSSEYEFPIIERLYISGKDCVPALAAFSCPNISTLTIHEYGFHESSLPLQPLRLQVNRWLNLRSIEITSDNTTWDNVSLPFVEIIAIRSPKMSPFEPINTSSSLLKELACHSLAFPSLNCLEMGRFPEWDLLFIMLERRNLSISKEVARITKLKLPSFPAPMLLQPLSSLLRGRIKGRPSNFDISLQALAKAYFDSDLIGCGECHKSFQPCMEPTPLIPYYSYQYQDETKELQIPPYPLNEDEVLATYLQRAVWWQETVQKISKRRPSCDRHMPYDPIEITGYSYSTS